MGKTVKVYAYDDLEGEHSGIEADYTDVPLRFGSWTGTIDLGKDNYDRLTDFLAPFLKAGTREGNVNPGGAKRGRKPHWYYEGLQAYAAERGVEIPLAGGKLSYPAGLRREYDEHLRKEAGG